LYPISFAFKSNSNIQVFFRKGKTSQNLIFSASSRTATNFCDLPKTPLNMCNHNNKQEMARHELQEVFPSKTKRSRKENHNPLWRVLLLRERSLDGSFLLPLFLSLATATQQKTTFQGTAQARTFCHGRAD
jgi:hypothetical protein